MNDYRTLILALREYSRHERYLNMRYDQAPLFDGQANQEFHDRLRQIYDGMDEAQREDFLEFLNFEGITL